MLSKSEIKYIQTLFQKKFRELEKTYLIEGPKVVEEALKTTGVAVKKILALPEWASPAADRPAHYERIQISPEELQRISQLKTPNQVVALIAMPALEYPTQHALGWTLALDGIQDPGNMGTIIRIADWFGISQIICSEDCADVYNAKVVQASMGSIFRVPVHFTPLADWLSQQQVPVVGARLEGLPLSSLHQMDRGILVIGNESKGIRPAVAACISQAVTIPKFGQAESLNAAVATGIILSHLK